jgi:hypothetical protein
MRASSKMRTFEHARAKVDFLGFVADAIGVSFQHS